jgi:hypothetical protein
MMPYRRNSPAEQRFTERRRREDEAPKLLTEVPTLSSLQIEVEERSGVGHTKYLRRVLVDRAPAMFLVPCGDPRCTDGEHDLTSNVMRALYARQTTFKVGHRCNGSVGTAECSREVQLNGTAEYRAS